jgi:cobalamin biosynthesis Mg chelatase CobN
MQNALRVGMIPIAVTGLSLFAAGHAEAQLPLPTSSASPSPSPSPSASPSRSANPNAASTPTPSPTPSLSPTPRPTPTATTSVSAAFVAVSPSTGSALPTSGAPVAAVVVEALLFVIVGAGMIVFSMAMTDLPLSDENS